MRNRFQANGLAVAGLGILVALLWPTGVRAQTAEGGHGELFGLGGLYHGSGLNAGAGGGGGGYTVNRHLRLFGEAFYFRKDLSDVIGFSGVKATGSAFVFDGGAQILFPAGSKTVPFATVGGGVGRIKGSAEARAGGQTIRASASESQGTVTLGGGLDYYVSNKWGIRPEFRVYRGPEYRATFGVFYRF